MSEDFTQQQPFDEQLAAEALSLRATSPPTQVAGYKIERLLGSGAFGQVWVAKDQNTGRRVAIKFYIHRAGVDWTLLDREVKHLVQLSTDRYIVQVLEVGWRHNPPYYVMEYLERGSLEDLLVKEGRFSAKQAIELFYGICIGLNHSHGKGVLHCDLKPANVLLDEDLRPRLADFGQSRMTNEQTPALGTLFYMAPEQADLTAAPDVRWDVYGLGAILYRMLVGSPPHRSSRLLQKIDTAGTLPKRLEQYRQEILRDGPPRDHHRARGVDRALAEIVDGCLQIDTEKRFANVQQVIEALDRRQLKRQRRPLVLLGIVGPLLLLLMTAVLTTRSILATRVNVEATLRERAGESNRLAAMFAARTLELELRKYFELVHLEANNRDLIAGLGEALTDPELNELRLKIASSESPAEARQKLNDNTKREALQRVLENYLRDYDGSDPGLGSIDLATVFVTDNLGTILAIAYDAPVPFEEDSTARNFAYRAYFHGGREDLNRSTDPTSIPPLNHTHLSPAFFSSATQTWKVAVSSPIYLQQPVAPNAVPDGVFVATTNLGGFDLMRSDDEANVKLNQVPMLVDARDGDRRGTIIQHPLINAPEGNSNPVSDPRIRSAGNVPAVSPAVLDRLLAGQDIDFRDPMGSQPGGQDYQGTWTAAVQPVSVPRIDDKDNDEQADLLVLVQYRLADVIAPVGELVTKLMWYGAAGLIGILLVIFLLWYMVSHSADDTWLLGNETPPAKKLPTGETETIASDR